MPCIQFITRKRVKLERSILSWEEPFEVGKPEVNWKDFVKIGTTNCSWKYFQVNNFTNNNFVGSQKRFDWRIKIFEVFCVGRSYLYIQVGSDSIDIQNNHHSSCALYLDRHHRSLILDNLNRKN